MRGCPSKGALPKPKHPAHEMPDDTIQDSFKSGLKPLGASARSGNAVAHARALHRITRRGALGWAGAALALPCWSTPASGWSVRQLPTPTPWKQLRTGPAHALLGTDREGQLWQLRSGGPVRRLAEGIDPLAPVAFGHGRIVARQRNGRLWVGGGASDGGTSEVILAAHAGLLVLPLAVLAVQGDAMAAHLVRLEPTGGGIWKVVARSKEPVLPDARPLQIDIDGRGDGGHVLVLAGPDRTRYPHAVLGDDIEATRVLWLERHDLSLLRSLQIEAPYVLEDIAPRPWQAGGSRPAFVSVRSGPQGAQLALIEADASSAGALRLAALGPPIGTRMRWLSPIADGTQLLAVHTPHIGGVLHRYRREGDRLQAERLLDGLSNHAIGSRELDVSAWLDSHLLIADGARKQLLIIDPDRPGAVARLEGVDTVVQMANGYDDRSVACLTAQGTLLLVQRLAAPR